MAALVKHLVQQVLSVGLEQVVLLGLPGAGTSSAATAHLFLHDGRDVRHVVRQRDVHVLRFLSPVPPLLLDDPLGDRRGVFRQRALADLVHCQDVQRFAGLLAQFQPADLDRDSRLAVPVQPALRPCPQIVLCAFALVCLSVIHPPVQVLVLAQVSAVQLQPVLARRVDPGIHSAAADAPLQRVQVPLSPHLAADRVIPLPYVQLEREGGQVIFPYRVFQRICDGLQGVQQCLPVELIGIADVIFKVAQRPRVVLAQDILHSLLRRAGCRSCAGDRLHRHLAQGDVVQRLDDVFQLNRPGVRVRVVRDVLHAPHIVAFLPVVVQQPVVERDLRSLRPQSDRARAVPFLGDHRLRLWQEPCPPRQALSAQFIHIMRTSRCS